MQEQVQSHGQDTLKKGQRGEVRHCLESKRCFCHSKSEIKKSYGNRMEIIWTSYESQESKERPGASPRDWLAHSHELAKQSQAPTLGSKACVHFLSFQAMESELDCAQRMFSQGRSQNVIIANDSMHNPLQTRCNISE